MLFCAYISQRVLIKEGLVCNANFPFRLSEQTLFACPPTKSIPYRPRAFPREEGDVSGWGAHSQLQQQLCFGQARCHHPSLCSSCKGWGSSGGSWGKGALLRTALEQRHRSYPSVCTACLLASQENRRQSCGRFSSILVLPDFTQHLSQLCCFLHQFESAWERRGGKNPDNFRIP